MPSVREYLKLLADYFECHPQQRFGQAAFNFLMYYSPEDAEDVRSNIKLDPFYLDSNVTSFIRWLEERWS